MITGMLAESHWSRQFDRDCSRRHRAPLRGDTASQARSRARQRISRVQEGHGGGRPGQGQGQHRRLQGRRQDVGPDSPELSLLLGSDRSDGLRCFVASPRTFLGAPARRVRSRRRSDSRRPARERPHRARAGRCRAACSALLAVHDQGPAGGREGRPQTAAPVSSTSCWRPAFSLVPLYYLPSLPAIPIIISEAVAVVLVRMSFTTELVPAVAPRRARRVPRAAASAATGREPGHPPARPDAVPDCRCGRAAGSSAPPSRGPGSRGRLCTAARGLGRV